MKKILALILALMMISAFALCVSAEDASEETEQTTEEITEETKEEILDTVSDWIEKVTSSTSIATLITTVLGFGGTGALLATKMKDILALVKNKADATTVVKTVQDGTKEIADSFTKELDGLKDKIAKEDERNKMLSGVLGIAFSYSKDIPASARAQIMALLNGTETGCESVQKIVETAKEAIEQAEATSEKIETPALDEIVGNIVMG